MLHISESQKMQFGFANIFRLKGDKTFYSSIAAAYIAYKLKSKYSDKDFAKTLDNKLDFIKRYCDESKPYNSLTTSFLRQVIDEFTVKAVEFALQFDEAVLLDFILHADDEQAGRMSSGFSTPDSISDLALEILDIKDGDSVIDNCSGVGSFVITAYEKQPNASYFGLELNNLACGVAALRAAVLSRNIKFEQGNVFEYPFYEKADKAFSDFPMGLRVKSFEGMSMYEWYRDKIPVLTKGTSADWLFNYRLSELIKPTGKAVSIMSLAGLWNTLDREIRKFFVQEKKIEAIITLPARLLANTALPVAMVVFGSGTDDGIRFIDATNEFVEGRRQCVLSNENIQHIKQALNFDSNISRVVSYDEIAKEDYSFAVRRYLVEKEDIKNGVEFSTIINNIRRGIQLTASELDSTVSSVPTDIKYITPADIQNGAIVNELKSLCRMERRFERYIVRTGSLLIAKNGYPFKIAVAKVESGKTLIASGNLYIIELDESRVNPAYVKAYLESDKGQASLKNIMVGATVLNIGATELGKVQIPLIDLEKQNEIATKYLAAMDNVADLRRKVEKAESELTEVLTNLFCEDD